MLFTPENYKLWDCWILHREGKYYLYHLSLRKELLGKSGWEGINLAISDDCVHWKEYGRVLEKSPEAEWIGTGMIQKIGDRYLMNFSEEKPKGTQRVYFAESKDLLNWKRIEGAVCRPDGVYYMDKPDDISNTIPRWDSVGIVDATEDKGAPYYGFVTSNTLQNKLPNKSGSLGLLTSEDGLHWRCLPNAFPDTDAFPAFEVPEHVELNGRHYVLFCTSSYLGFRFDSLSEDMSGGTFYVTADSLTGPYRLPDGDFMLQGTRNNEKVSMVTVGRPLKVGDQTWYYHIWGDNGPDGWVGTVKLLEEESPYRLRLKYNPVNDVLFGKELAGQSYFQGAALVKNVGKLPPMRFFAEKNALRFENLGTSAALEGMPLSGSVGGGLSDLSDGRIVTAALTIADGEGAGVYFGTSDGKRPGVFVNRKRGRVEFGFVKDGWGPNLVFVGDLYQKTEIPETVRLLLLVRREFFELYLNGIYVSSWRSGESIDPNRFGAYFEDASGKVEDLHVSQMR